MNHVEQIRWLEDEIQSVIHRARQEFDIPYATAIGVLDILKHTLLKEATPDNEEEY